MLQRRAPIEFLGDRLFARSFCLCRGRFIPEPASNQKSARARNVRGSSQKHGAEPHATVPVIFLCRFVLPKNGLHVVHAVLRHPL